MPQHFTTPPNLEGSFYQAELPLQNFLLILSCHRKHPHKAANMSGLFNTIGEKADKVAPATIPDNQNGAAPEEDERVVDEIESLCMNCEENVSRIELSAAAYTVSMTVANHNLGHDAPPSNQNPLLPRSHPHVLFVR